MSLWPWGKPHEAALDCLASESKRKPRAHPGLSRSDHNGFLHSGSLSGWASMVAAFREGLNDVVYAEGRNVVSLGGRKLRSTDSTSGQTKALSLLIAIYRLSLSRSPPRACARHRDQFYEPRLGDEVDWPFVPGEARFLCGRDGRFAPLRRCLILFECTSSCFSVRAEVSTAPRVIAGRNPPAPHTTPRRTPWGVCAHRSYLAHSTDAGGA